MYMFHVGGIVSRVYCATVTQDNDASTHTYTGMCSTTFIVRHRNNKSSFINEHLEQKSTLSKFIWKLKRKNIGYNIQWDYLKSSKSYKPGDRACGLCLAEAKSIIFKKEFATLNKRNEILQNCRHKFKFKLKYCKAQPSQDCEED